MWMSLSRPELKEYIRLQIAHYFPDGNDFAGEDVDEAFERALARLENCFRHIINPYYSDEDRNAYFSHLHSDQYAHFLYYLSNSLWELSQNKLLCDKLIFLNKTLNGFFFSYKGKLPDIFLFSHPVGTIIGNAAYSDYLVISQDVTVNTDADENGMPAPRLGKWLYLAAGAKIIGSKPIGDRVSIGVNVTVYDRRIEDDSVVTLEDNGCLTIRHRRSEICESQHLFREELT